MQITLMYTSLVASAFYSTRTGADAALKASACPIRSCCFFPVRVPCGSSGVGDKQRVILLSVCYRSQVVAESLPRNGQVDPAHVGPTCMICDL